MTGLQSRPRMVRTRDGSPTLWSPRYAQTYGSTAGAWTEACWVYRNASGLQERLARGKATRVFEVGLGAGLNFLVAADAAWRHRTPLEYVAVERDPIPGELMQAMKLEPWISHRPLLDRWRQEYTLAAFHRLRSLRDCRSTWSFRAPPFVRLHVHVEDASHLHLPPDTFDIIFLDAFSPEMNPELWTEDFLKRLMIGLRPAGRITTYCVRGTVRRSLTRLGLQVDRLPGPPGGKREILRATKPPVSCKPLALVPILPDPSSEIVPPS